MKDRKLKILFEAARNDVAPPPASGFADDTVAAIRRTGAQERAPASVSLLDQLSRLFPRLAVLSLLIIGLSAATAFYVSERDAGSTSDFNQLTEEWVFDQDNS